MKRVLTIAGSDPSSGAGIQADLKTFTAFGVYGITVLTSITVQNTKGVEGIYDLPPNFVASQLESVLNDIGADAVKTGMLSTAEVVQVTCEAIRRFQIPNLLVDPVMKSHAGQRLLKEEAVQILKEELIPLATVVTPNIPEAEVLSGIKIESLDEMKEAAKEIYRLGAGSVLVKGGHLEEGAVDILYDGRKFTEFRAERIVAKEVHGTGCVYSAAITVGLAQGKSLRKSIEEAKDFVTRAIKQALSLGSGLKLINPNFSKLKLKEL